MTTSEEACEKIAPWPGRGEPSCFKRHVCSDSLRRAAKRPLEVDISDYSDEYVAGFLAGQVNALQWLGGAG